MSNNSMQQAVINPEAPADSLERKQPDIDHGVAVVDKTRYYSREFMQREADQVWARAWLLAGVVADIPNVGDFFVFDVGIESIIVTRTDEGIKAFYNVCSHRGNRLVTAQRGNKKVFVCPFHSWSFNNDGALRHVTDRATFRNEVLCHNPGLVPVNCDEKAGIIFINMSANPPPLEQGLGLPPGYLEAYNIDRMRVVRHVSSEWDANWKIGVEAFYESYHLHAVHPETRGIMGDLNVQYDLYPGGASRMIVPLGQPSPRMSDQETVNEGLQAMLQDAGVDPGSFTGSARDVRRAIQVSKRARAEELGLDYARLEDGQLSDSWATGLFPNVQIGCHPEGVFIMRFLPHATDPEKFYYDTMTLIFPADDPNYTAPAWMGLPDDTDLTGNVRPACEHFSSDEDANLGAVLSQDSELLPVVQRGLHSRGFKGQLWGEQEQRLRHFHAELDRYLAEAEQEIR
jgi:phenylpropionate dioxygenase-like ring-hydroxylating dioxygenase large terminal subunit